MKLKRWFVGMLAWATVGVALAGDGRSASDIMSHYLATKSQGASALKMLPGADLLTQEQCLASPLNSSGPALVFHDPQLLRSRFQFSRTLSAIVASSPQPTTSTVGLMQSMLDSYTVTQRTNPEGLQLTMPVDFRFGESGLNASALVNNEGMKPVGLFNRFDLANSNGLNCGEYRLVYAMDSIAAGAGGTFLIIFEAKYPNPTPLSGLSGCAPVAEFWASLDDAALTDVQRADLLERFYYDGLVHNGVALPPVVRFERYASGAGQVRTNNFVDFNWQLREFRTAESGSEVVFAVDTNKDNPLAELYNIETVFNGDSVKFASMVDSFQNEFVGVLIDNLTNPERNGATSATDIINGVVMGNTNAFNEFQSDAQSGLDIPNPDPVFDNSVATAVAAAPFDLSSAHIFNRAGAMSCGGCHQFSNNRFISSTVRWPNSAGFVHVTENGVLSSALTGSFLPKREELLREFVCGNISEPPAPPQPPSSLGWLVPVIEHLVR